uniref:Uncharacterized protein n=1 Tax=Ciona savignyi TaxID=51511 RepID=H2YL03_CIOSA
MLAKPVFRSVMLVGSCTAWSMEFNLMGKCRVTRLVCDRITTTPSTLSLARPVLENMYQGRYL